MFTTLILVAALPCLAPKPVHHHVKPVPEQTCQVLAPKDVMCLQPEPQLPDPVEMNIYRYYDIPPTAVNPPGPAQAWSPPGYYVPGYDLPIAPGVVRLPPAPVPPTEYLPPPTVVYIPPVKAPEIDAGGGLMACVFLAGTLAVMRGRRG